MVLETENNQNALKIYDIKNKQEYLREVAELTQKEWGSITTSEEAFNDKVNKKVEKMISKIDDKDYCKTSYYVRKKGVSRKRIFQNFKRCYFGRSS